MARTNSKVIVIKMRSKKKSVGRPRKDVVIKEKDLDETVGLSGMFQHTEQDLFDELHRLDSFYYFRFNQ